MRCCFGGKEYKRKGRARKYQRTSAKWTTEISCLTPNAALGALSDIGPRPQGRLGHPSSNKRRRDRENKTLNLQVLELSTIIRSVLLAEYLRESCHQSGKEMEQNAKNTSEKSYTD